MTPFLACRDLRRRFGATIALDGLSLDVPEGAFFTLLGPSGCGKTTLLRAIAGFEPPDSGTIALAGTALDRLPPHLRPVNTVFQGYALFPHLSVADNIAFGPAMQRRPRAEIAAQVEAMLALVRLPGFGARMPAQLSGGQQQRVALARALAARPRLLLLDEPLSALDRKLRGEMRDELKRLQAATGLTFVFVTHDQQEALSLSDGVAVMRAGRVEQVGTPADIYERPATRFVADFVGEANLLPARRLAATRFEVAGQMLETARPGPPGRPILVLRPERAHLAPPGTASQGLDGTVIRSVYDGPDTTLHIAVGPLELRVRHSSAAPPPGAAVRILIAPAALAVVADEDETPG